MLTSLPFHTCPYRAVLQVKDKHYRRSWVSILESGLLITQVIMLDKKKYPEYNYKWYSKWNLASITLTQAATLNLNSYKKCLFTMFQAGTMP